MMYQLVFRGECTPGVDVQTARHNAMALFKATDDQVDRMFSGQRVVIRNKLDEAQVRKYEAVMRKHGMVAHVETMDGKSAGSGSASSDSAVEKSRESVAERPAPPQPATSAGGQVQASETGGSRNEAAPRQSGVSVEPGDRLSVAGEKVDGILAGSSLQLDAAHERLSETIESEAPMFEHLDEWTLAPVGSALTESRDETPVPTPDISHLSLADDDVHQKS